MIAFSAQKGVDLSQQESKSITHWKLQGGKHFISATTPIVIGDLKVACLMRHQKAAPKTHTCSHCGKAIGPGHYIRVTQDTNQRKPKQVVSIYHLGCSPKRFKYK
jgi:ribosomal protein L24E